MKKAVSMLFLVIITACLLTGCGGGSSATGTGTDAGGSIGVRVSYPQDQNRDNPKEDTAVAYYILEVCDASQQDCLITTLRMDYPQTEAVINNIPAGNVDVDVTGYDGKNSAVLTGTSTTTVSAGSAATVEINLEPVESPTSSPTATISPSQTPSESPTASPVVTPTESPSPSPSPTGKWTALVSYPCKEEQSCDINGTAVSDNGSIVVFSTTQQLISEHTNSFSQIYLYATATGTLRIISKNSSGQIGNGNSKNAAISGNGKMTAFSSGADNLIGTGMDTNEFEDIFAVNLENNTIGMISVSYSNPTKGGGGTSDMPSLSYDGSKVVFQSKATNIVPTGQTILEQSNIFISIISKKGSKPASSNTQLVSNQFNSSVMLEGGGKSVNGRISGNGNFVVYQTYATDVSPGPTPVGAVYEIILCDLTKPLDSRGMTISQKNGSASNPDAVRPFINYDGTVVVFESGDNNLGGTSGSDIYIWANSVLSLVNQPTGSGPSPLSYHPTVDKTGRYVAFQTYGMYNAADTNGVQDIYIWDSQTKAYTIASVDSNGTIAETTTDGSVTPAISGDGNYVTFVSTAKNLAQGPASSQGYMRNNIKDVYLRKWQ
ncbi:MAG: hypothetical protein LWY06_14590 [Firmicutes bacterium]|nr:hypothetical protein [Bacillota bacterium]